MHLGCVTYNILKDLDLDSLIKLLESTGFEAVELRTGHKHGVEPIAVEGGARQGSRALQAEQGQAAELWDDLRVPIAGRRRCVSRTSKRASSSSTWLYDTGAIAVKVRPNGLPNGIAPEVTVKNIGAGLRELGEYAANRGIEIWMEVHGRETQSPTDGCRDPRRRPSQERRRLLELQSPRIWSTAACVRRFALLKPYIKSAHIN